MNKESQLVVTADHKIWLKGDNEMIDANWLVGVSADQQKDKRILFVSTAKIILPSCKTLQEARGTITSDYQSQLEKIGWIV